MESINRNNNDPFYRYKMPKIIISHSKSRTTIDNLYVMFKALTKYADNQKKRTADELMKWFKYSLAANVTNNILSGIHPDEKVIDSLHEYIACYILCGECGNPETTLFSIGKELRTNCKACGKDVGVKSKQSKYNNYLIKLLA